MKSAPALPRGVEYRPVPGFPKLVAGEDGTVWTRDRYATGWRRVVGSGSRRKTHVGGPDGAKVATTVAVLVCLAWVGPRPAGAYPNFKDGDATNRRAGNLDWGPLRTGRPRKLTPDQQRFVRVEVASGRKRLALAVRFGVAEATIRHAARGYQRKAT